MLISCVPIKLLMINRFSLIILFAVFTPFFLSSQNVTDALRYSSFEVGGTARSIGAGGALGALGADFSVLSTNPAGMAWYRSSDFVFTPSFYRSSTTSELLNDKGSGLYEENRTNFNLNSFGMVVASQPRDASWSTFNFGLGFNRLANFHNDFYFEGTSEGSIVNRFLEQINGDVGFATFESEVAVEAGALYDLDNDGVYESDFDDFSDASIFRSQDVNRRGAINELVFSFAGNYQEKLMLGATLGVPFVSFREEKTYRENDPGSGVDGNVLFFDDLEYTEVLNTTGAGINLKLGAIYRVNQALRLGVAIHTPTAISLQDDFNTTMEYSFTDAEGPYTGNANSPDGFFEYKLRTPWRFIGSAGYIVGKSGFVSADIEYVDYTNNEFNYDGFNDAEREVNSEINQTLSQAITLRLGGELAVDIFRLRAGLKLLQSPLEGDDTFNNTISGGLGMFKDGFYLDVAYQRNNVRETYVPYIVSDAYIEQQVETDTDNNQLVFTIGFRF